MWKTLLFDFDGTIADTGDGIKKSFQYAFEQMGRPVPAYDELDMCIGPPLQDSFRDFFGMSEAEAEEGVRLYRQRYTKIGLYEANLYSGLIEALMELKRRGLILAVASCKPEVMVRQLLCHFGIESFFTVVVGSNLDGTRSTKKAVIDETLRRLGQLDDRSKVVYIGDRKYDVIGARQCGLSSIGVTYGYGSFEELREVRPTFMAASPGMIVELIDSENGPRSLSGQPLYGSRPYSAGREVAPPSWAAAGSDAAGVPSRPEGWLRRFLRVLGPVALFFVLSNVISAVVALIYTVVIGVIDGYGDTGSVLMQHAMTIQGAANLIMIPIYYVFMKQDKGLRVMRGNERAWLDGSKLKIRFILVASLLTLAVAMTASYLIDLTGIPNFDVQFQEFNDIAYSDPLVLQILSIVILGPICEELVFRGLVYRRIRDYIGYLPAVFLSSIMFGAFHLNLTQGLFAFALGIILALIYEKYGRLWLPIAGHMANNLFATLTNNLAGPDAFVNQDIFSWICIGAAVAMCVLVFALKRPDPGVKIPERERKFLF